MCRVSSLWMLITLMAVVPRCAVSARSEEEAILDKLFNNKTYNGAIRPLNKAKARHYWCIRESFIWASGTLSSSSKAFKMSSYYDVYCALNVFCRKKLGGMQVNLLFYEAMMNQWETQVYRKSHSWQFALGRAVAVFFTVEIFRHNLHLSKHASKEWGLI